ncbi:MAG: hybrid sensor histidine kinase/response regulator [Archangium sp.]
MNLLLVDDDENSLLAIETVLGSLQQRVFKARSGRDALRLLLQHEFAAILLDVKMPDMDGFECAKMIREREKSARTPIIFLTGVDEGRPPIFQAYEVGAVDYLIKPVDPAILRGKLQVFVELALKTREVKRVAEELRRAQQVAHERELLTREKEAAVAQQRWLEAALDTQRTGLVLIEAGASTPRYANRAARELANGAFTGGTWPVGMTIHDGDDQLVTPDQLPLVRASRGERINGEVYSFTEGDRSGSVLAFSENLPPLPGTRGTMLLNLQDVTVLKRAEAELRSTLQTREDFLAVGSHELRTPITALKFQVRNAIKSWDRPETLRNPASHALSYLRQVQGSVDRLARLSEYLLDVSRLSANGLQLKREGCDLAEIAREVALRPSPDGVWTPSSVSIKTSGDTSGFWDRTRVDQLISNLVENARKYAPGPLEIDVTGGDDVVTFTLQDHGPGIPEDQLTTLFGRFTRSRAPEDTRGFGLGLWIVSQLARHHDGTVVADSVPGKGARFVVTLPRGTPSVLHDEHVSHGMPAPLP